MPLLPARLLWLFAPLFAVAVTAAPQWPARAQMIDHQGRDIAYPLAQGWARIVGTALGRTAPVPAPTVARAPGVPRSGLIARTPAVAAPPSSAPAPWVVAQAAAQPPIAPHAVAVPQTGTVLMLGDSLMGSVVAGVRPLLSRRYTLSDRHKASTGLSNREYYDWPAMAHQAALELQPTWAVVHLGGNDGQDILAQGRWLRFGSPAWTAAYQARAEELIDELRQAQPQVHIVWLGLPAMRPPQYEAKSATIAAVQRAAAQARGVPYVDGREVLGASYSKDGVGTEGRRQVWRADDGIHYTRAGGSELGRAIGAAAGWSLGP